jgi:hypothetical protein
MNDHVKSPLAMCEDPADYFSHSLDEMYSIEPAQLEQAQLEVLKIRFGQLRERIPMLQTLTDKAGIHELDTIESVVPLLFDHTLYKSYPPSLLANSRFDALTRWLNKLTTHDLSQADVSNCHSIDEWIDTLDRETPLLVGHSSGTSGTVSFLPLEKEDFRRAAACWPVQFLQEFGKPQSYFGECPEMHVVTFDYRRSRRTAGRYNDYIRDYFAGSEQRYHTLHPETMSADLMYLAGKMRAAQAQGNVDSLNVNPALLERKDEFLRLKENETARIEPFFQDIVEKYSGQRVFILSFTNIIYNIAKNARDKGYSKLFAPDSVVFTSGGNKGETLPEDWKETVKELVGVDRIAPAYGMSEIMGMMPMCSQGHYHFVPWIIPYVLDPDNGESLPRKGTVTGRAAFFDLGCQSHWGGFVSGDEITAHWDEPCPCGMKGGYMEDNVVRYSEKRGGDDKITCAATADAHNDALDFLLEL